jgi:hypothetical protein
MQSEGREEDVEPSETEEERLDRENRARLEAYNAAVREGTIKESGVASSTQAGLGAL